jgi:hypothetical protein
MLKSKNPSHLEVVDVFYILDMDRCLVNTEKLVVFLRDIVAIELGIDEAEMDIARREYEKEGGSFDTAAFVMSVMDGRGKDGPAEWHHIKERFVTRARDEDMLEPYASELLAILRYHNYPLGIVTYGGEQWQTAKMTAAGLIHIPHLVTHNSDKGRLIASWQLVSGYFLVPSALTGRQPVIAKKLVFIDDKPISFKGIPAEVTSICAIAPGVVWSTKVLGALPDSVVVVHGLHEAIQLLFGHQDDVYIDKA